MTLDRLVEAAASFVKHFDQLTRGSDPRSHWQQALSWLAEATGATGGWLQVRGPIPCTHQWGELDEDALAFLTQWADEMALSPQDGTVVHHLAADTLLCIVATAEPGHVDDDTAAIAREPLPGPPCILLALRFVGTEPSLAPHRWEEGKDFAKAFSQLQLALRAFSIVSRQAASLQQLEDTLRRFRHLYEVGQAISSTLDLDLVLQQSAERVTEVLRAEASSIILVDEARRELVFKVPAGPAEHVLREQRIPLDKGVAGWVAMHGTPLIIPDVTQDERFYPQMDALSGFRTRSILAVPLQVKGRTIGIVEVINKTDGSSFTESDVQWLSILTPLIAAAIENARLYTALRDERDRIITAEDNVRHELARDLHDGPAQILSAMILNIDMARRELTKGPDRMAVELNFLESLAQQANQEVRSLLFSLRPLVLETHGLIAALNQLVERTRAMVPYQVNLDIGALPEAQLDDKVASTLFVIIQEALNNVTRHANAQHVYIRLSTSEEELQVEVEDDGVGFNVQEVNARYSQRGSFGLLNMRERARLIEGRIEVISPIPSLGRGTLVRVNVPLARAYP